MKALPCAAAISFLFALLLPAPAIAAGVLRTVLVIDASSSMRSTDPKEIRKVAAELFIDLTRDGDQLAVAGFDGAARESTGGFTTIRGPTDRDALKRAVRAVGNDGNHTDFTAGLGEAKRLLDAAADEPGDQEMIVFLTDGRCEPDPKGAFAEVITASPGPPGRRLEEACQEKVIGEILPSLGRTRVYAIGLSRGAPKAFIEKLGAQSGGAGLLTDRADELPRLFADVYARLLGSKLSVGPTAPTTDIDVGEGMLTADFILSGPPSLTAGLMDPSGAEVPLDNRDPAQVYFSDNPAYRLIKVVHPIPGRWKLSAGGGGKGGRYAVLQNMDLNLEFMDLPEVFEIGKERAVRFRLSTPGGKTPPMELLDRHEMTLRAAETPSKCVDSLRASGGPAPVVVKRGPKGDYEIHYTATRRGELCFEARMSPGPAGVLSRLLLSPARKVVPPLRIQVTATPFGPVKQGAKGAARLSFEGSEIGEAIEGQLALGEGAAGLLITPLSVALSPNGPMTLDLSVDVERDAAPGVRTIKATIRPVRPGGYDDRAASADLVITVVPLTFWERYGTWVKIGAGALLFLVLLVGVAGPARFRRGSMLHYKDGRDPDLPRQASYPLAAKAKAGFYRGARVMVGATGPVRMGGVVELKAGPGGSVSARPLGGRKAREVPRSEDEGGTALPGEGREVPLKNGAFRVATGTKYEIEGTGLSFWVTLR